MNDVEISAPKKAAPTSPSEETAIPFLRKKIMLAATHIFAPDEIPRTKGPAIGFWK